MGMPYPYGKPLPVTKLQTRTLPPECGAMGKYVASFLTLLLVYSVAFCQSGPQPQNPVFGVHYILNDFKSAQAVHATSLRTAVRNKQFGRFSQMSQGLALNYVNGINTFFDYSATLTGSFPDDAYKNVTTAGKGHLLLEFDASVRAKLLSTKYLATPYVQAGIGASYYDIHWGAFVPAGVGVQIEVLSETFLLINAQYRIAFTDKASDHFMYGIGLAGSIGKKKKPVKPALIPQLPAITIDNDFDGVADSLDQCPLQKGLAMFQGCPDTDGDSIPDKDDKCPYEKGLQRYQGCPIRDTDNDGTPDETDLCPTEKGLPVYQGCPAPDRDKDGLADELDKCPDVPGPIANNGCPEIAAGLKTKVDRAAQNIFFATGSAILLSKSYPALEEVIDLLKANPAMKIDIEGHTDNTGHTAGNQVLSEKRAGAVYAYFKKKGIAPERMRFAGFGETRPIASNNTIAGRSTNRRVVLHISYE